MDLRLPGRNPVVPPTPTLFGHLYLRVSEKSSEVKRTLTLTLGVPPWELLEERRCTGGRFKNWDRQRYLTP